jgi:hypothetical protein
MLDFLSSALGGGALGVLLRIGNGFFEEFRAGREHGRKLEEAKVLASIRQDEAAWKAFEASQQASVVPPNVHAWVADVVTLFRPFLTISLVLIATVIWFYAAEPSRASMTDQVTFAAFNCVGWWFGDRAAYRAKLK